MTSKSIDDRALIVSLKLYGSFRCTEHADVQYRKIDKNGLTIEQACLKAAEALERMQEEDAVDRLKFERLKAGLKKHGAARLYEHIMGEPIDA